MRSARRALGAWTAALAASALAACGTWSNDDAVFVAALPSARQLQVALPVAAAQALCAAPGASEVWGWARPAGDGFNRLVEAMLAFVDYVRALPPTERHDDLRIWGPFDDDKHPGNEVRITMQRTIGADGVPAFAYVFGARVKGVGDFLPMLEGRFVGASARAGRGELTLHFENARALGTNAAGDPTEPLNAQYDRSADPRTLALALQNASAGGVSTLDYGFAGYASGSGRFDFNIVNAQQQAYVVTTSFDATGAGKADVALVLATGARYGYSECWDAAGCITAVVDPRAGSVLFPDGVSKLCPGGVCPSGPCPTVP